MSASKGPDWYNAGDIDKMHMLAACHEGSIERVQEFLMKGVQVDEFDDDRVTALQISAAKGHTHLTEFLLSFDPDLERCNVVGFTPLLHACREGHLEVVKLLVQRGAKLDVTTFTGASPLTLACAGGHFELVKHLLLFKDVVDINPKKHDISPSPLMAAAFKNQPIIASCLVSRGARVDYVMPQFVLDIMSCVVMCSSATMFSTLLELGAKPEAIRNFKNSNIDDLVNICGRVDIWRVLQDHRKKLQRHYPSTVDIKRVIEEGRIVEIVDLLQHPEKWAKLEENQTPLMYAVVFGQTEIVSAIIGSRTAEIDAKESRLGLTALMIAAILGDNELIMMLLRANARVNIKCDFDWTALDFAYHAGDTNTKVIEMMHKRLVNRPIQSKKAELRQPVTSVDTLATLNKSKRNTLNFNFFKFISKFSMWDTEDSVDYTPRDSLLCSVDVANVDFAYISEPFFTATDILHPGYGRRQKHVDSSLDVMLLICNVAKSWFKNGFLMKPFALGIPNNGDYDKIYDNIKWNHANDDKTDGNYSEAQKNCAFLKNAQFSFGPSNLSSSNSLSSTYSESNSVKKTKSVNRKVLSSSASGITANQQLSPTMSNPDPNKNPSLFVHLRSSSYQSGSPEKYQYLKEAASPRISPQRLHKLSDPDFIHQRLKSIGLQQYYKAFKEQEVDFQTFLKCDEADIRQIVESSPNYDIADIPAIMNLIADLRQNYGSSYKKQ